MFNIKGIRRIKRYKLFCEQDIVVQNKYYVFDSKLFGSKTNKTIYSVDGMLSDVWNWTRQTPCMTSSGKPLSMGNRSGTQKVPFDLGVAPMTRGTMVWGVPRSPPAPYFGDDFTEVMVGMQEEFKFGLNIINLMIYVVMIINGLLSGPGSCPGWANRKIKIKRR